MLGMKYQKNKKIRVITHQKLIYTKQYSTKEIIEREREREGSLLGAALNYTEPLRQEFPPVYMAFCSYTKFPLSPKM